MFSLEGLQADIGYDLGRTSKAVCEYYFEKAKDLRIRQKDNEVLHPVCIFRSEKQEVIVGCGAFMKNNDTKEMLSKGLMQVARDVNAIACAFLSEAWTASVPLKGDKDAAVKEAMLVPPSKRPDRVEVVMVSAQYKGQKTTLQIGELQRDEKGKLLRIVHCDIPDGMTSDGRFSNLLDDGPSKPDDDLWNKVRRRLGGA